MNFRKSFKEDILSAILGVFMSVAILGILGIAIMVIFGGSNCNKNHYRIRTEENSYGVCLDLGEGELKRIVEEERILDINDCNIFGDGGFIMCDKILSVERY